MVDFLANVAYLEQPREVQSQTIVVSALAGSYLEKKQIEKLEVKERAEWAKKFLAPHRTQKFSQVTEILVPYLARNHWSLFVFHRNKVYHLDSSRGIHDPSRDEREFVVLVHTAWLVSLGAKVPDPKDLIVTDVQVAQQYGGTVCGFALARNLRIWLEVRRVMCFVLSNSL